MGRYIILFVSEFHTGSYQYILYSCILFPIFLAACPCFAFKKYGGTSKFPFRALYMPLEGFCMLAFCPRYQLLLSGLQRRVEL
jgi:hypothetical protein